MRILVYASLIVILVGLAFVGCSVFQTGTNENADQVEVQQNVELEPTASARESEISDNIEVVVYKSPTCGCCTSWESYLEDAGFEVTSNSTDKLTEIKKEHNVPESLGSCHTALVDGYVIEGHVPVADIETLLKQRPDIVGLAVPGMPKNSPGMQPKGEKPAGFDVLSFDKRGKTEIFTSY